MNLVANVNTWAEKQAERRRERWADREESLSTRLPRWRTQYRVQVLIRVYLSSLVIGFVTAAAQVFWPPLLFAWIPFTVFICVSWTMLRTVINARDVAPDPELDEYEAAVLRTWQVVAYGWTTLIVLAVSLFMILVSVANPGNLDRWVYTGGLFTVLGLMSATALPTIAYARTFGPVLPQSN